MALDKTKIINICGKIILFSLYIIAFFFPISKAIIEIFSTLAIVCWIIKKILQQKNIPITQLNLAIFAYLAICFFSIFISSNLKISSRTFFGKILQDVTLFFVIADTLNTERRIKSFLYILFCSSLVLGVDGIYQYFTHKDFIRHRLYVGKDRIHATFPTANDFACYLNTVIPFTLVSFFVKLRLKSFRFLFASLFTLLFICLILTISRGGWFAFLSILLFMSIWIHSLAVFLLITGIFIIIGREFCYPTLPSLKERLTNFFNFLDSSSIDRDKIWDTAWRMFIHRPWLGLGIGTFMFNFNKFVVGTYTFGTPYAHNCYLQIACEVGIIGLLSFLSILILFFSHGIETIDAQPKTFQRYVLLASMAAILGYCVQMAVDTSFYSLDLGMLFWVLLGLGAAAINNIKLETVTPK